MFAVAAVALTGTAAPAIAQAQSAVTCESQGNRYRNCRVNTRGSARLERQLSETPCIYGRTWGFDYNSVWVDRGCRGRFVVAGTGGGWEIGEYGRRVTCESHGDKYQFCAATTRGDVRVVRQISSTPCRPGRNWGFNAQGIWVANGCRAEFEVGYGDVQWTNGNRRVRCESEDNRYRRCRVWTYGEVTIYRQLSQTQCRRNTTWGYDSNGIWVNDGCRADFLIGAGGGGWGDYPGGGGTGGVEGRARTECVEEARRRGYQSVNVTNANMNGGNADVDLRAWKSSREYRVGCRYSAFNSRAQLTSENPVGSGGGNSAEARGRQACENRARGMGYQSVNVISANQRASEVDVAMRARQAGSTWSLKCKYRISSNSATIYDQSQEGGGGSLIGTAKNTCADKARSLGFQVMGYGDTRQMSEAVKVYFTLRRGSDTYPKGECNYIMRDRVATVAPGNPGPQPR
jgi:hypothetical protein